jgi:hypothetical protein
LNRLALAAAVLAALCLLSVLTGCGAAPGAADPALLLGASNVVGSYGPITAGTPAGPGAAAPPRASVGPSCSGQGTCLALKYVSYIDPATGAPVIGSDEAVQNLSGINQLWAACGVQFEIEQYAPVDPARYSLNFSTASYAELDQIRGAFAQSGELLVVTTGPWDRSGDLGSSEANAWTAMPGGPLQGTVLEAPVGGIANMIAHELGHYLNLSHVADELDLMNPIIYSSSDNLTADQCGTVRSATAFFWPQMYR